MKKIAWIAWAVALIFFGDICVEEYTGVAEGPAGRVGREPVRAEKASNPEGFSTIMAYQWIRCALFIGIGGVFIGLHRWLTGFDILDPESTYDPEAAPRTPRASSHPPPPNGK